MSVGRHQRRLVLIVIAGLVALLLASCSGTHHVNKPTPTTHTSQPPAPSTSTTPSPSPSPRAIDQWIKTSKTDVDQMYVAAQHVRADDKSSCDALYEQVMITDSWLPAPDAQLTALLRAATNAYYRATQSCSFGIGTFTPNIDRADALMRRAIARGTALSIDL